MNNINNNMFPKYKNKVPNLHDRNNLKIIMKNKI